MTTYYKQINENNELVLLLTYNFTPKITNPLIIEITQEEYEKLSAEIQSSMDEETIVEPSEIEQKAQAYDILVGEVE